MAITAYTAASAILAAILKNGAIFWYAVNTIEVGLRRAFQRYITRLDIPTRSKVRLGAAGAPLVPLGTNVTILGQTAEG